MDEKTLVKELGTSEEYGVKNGSIANFLTKQGFFCYANIDATIEEIKNFLEKGLPVIVNFIEPSMQMGHFALVVGFENDELILNDPWNGEGFRLTIKDFERSWVGEDIKVSKWLLVASKEDLRLGKQFRPVDNT